MLTQQKVERDQRKKKLIITLILLVVCIAMFAVSYYFFSPRYQSMRQTISDSSSLVRKINSVEAESAHYAQMIDESGKEFGDLFIEKNDYIEFIGDVIKQNRLNINKMTVDDTVYNTDGVNTLKTEIELQGDLYNIKNMIQQLYDSEVASRIGSFSYRLQVNKENYPWMWRDLDDISHVEWWDLQWNEEQYLREQFKAGEIKEEPVHLISADDLLKHGTALCYIEIYLLGT